jgi:hypothetical protein
MVFGHEFLGDGAQFVIRAGGDAFRGDPQRQR